MNTTKENISDALKRLLQKKSLAKVTIADITRECGVTRMTFYYHFTDIYDLILWICENDKRVALEDIEDAGRWQEGFLSLLETARKNKSFVSNVCSNVDRKLVEKYLHNATGELLKEVIDTQAEGIRMSEADKTVAVDFYKYAVVGAELAWVEDGMQEMPRTLVDGTARMVQGDFKEPLKYLCRTSLETA